MKNFLNSKFQNRGENSIGHINTSNKSGLPTINLGIGDLDITTDEKIISASFNDAMNGHTHYTDPRGTAELREKISNYHRDNFKNYEFNLDEVIVTSGACHGLYLVFKSILDPQDEIILLSPFFAVYKDAISLSDGIPVIVETKLKNNFQLIKEDILSKITSKTKAIVINNPCNPTGVVYNKKSLEIIREIAIEKDLLIIADDVYDFYTFDNEFTPIYTLPDMKERSVSICSFSKNFAMTGWRLGYAIGPSEIIKCMDFINQSIVYSPQAMSQRAAIYALDNFKNIKSKQVPLFKERVEYAYERVKKINKFKCIKPQGGIYLFINIEQTNFTSKEFCQNLLEKTGVIVIPGDGFGASGFVRIACTVEIDKLKEAFDRIEIFIENL